MTHLNTYLTTLAFRLRERQEGQTMAEYAVVLGVVTIAAVAAFIALGGKIDGAIDKVTSLIKTS